MAAASAKRWARIRRRRLILPERWLSGRWIFGNEDETPSPADVDEYKAALKAGGVPYVFHRYDNAGHAFQSFNSGDYYRHDISEDAWTKVCAFLNENLV